ncbi:MAG TPA: YeeE/YedE family protein [Burkholderiales bacterium]|nr:YeeE/YedE family protein [Burkholderiales bacterium]
MNAVSAFVVGLIFGTGLIISGMTDPSKIIGFLDVAGAWDPSLAFVMGGAVLVGLIAFRFARRRTVSFLGGAMHLPNARLIDRPLVLGSLAFGVGWGLAGYCPGPAVVAFGSGQDKAVVFLVAMIAGMALYEAADRHFHARRRRRTPRELSDVAGDA